MHDDEEDLTVPPEWDEPKVGFVFPPDPWPKRIAALAWSAITILAEIKLFWG